MDKPNIESPKEFLDDIDLEEDLEDQDITPPVPKKGFGNYDTI